MLADQAVEHLESLEDALQRLCILLPQLLAVSAQLAGELLGVDQQRLEALAEPVEALVGSPQDSSSRAACAINWVAPAP